MEEPGKEDYEMKHHANLLENLAHLYCEPLYFDKAEQLLEEAEKLYKDKGEDVYLKFLLKKAAFLKKNGFFDEAVNVLDKMQKGLNLTKDFHRKIEFKIHRDRARLMALLRRETEADKEHKLAEEKLKAYY